MKICVIGAPSTGKSVFAKMLAAAMSRQRMSTELVQEYASLYIQKVGAPAEPWEQLVISMGQYMAEQETTRDFMVTDAAAFATFVYAKRLLPSDAPLEKWAKYRHLLDMLQQLARQSANSYDVIFYLPHVFSPQKDGVRLDDHISQKECEEIGMDLEDYLKMERVAYSTLDVRQPEAVDMAVATIQQHVAV